MVDESVNEPKGNDREPAAASTDGTSPDSLDTIRKERDALQDRLLRTAAEFDNFRKRSDRERRELSEYAAADLLTDILPVVDDLERALQVPASGDADAYRKGVELILKQM